MKKLMIVGLMVLMVVFTPFAPFASFSGQAAGFKDVAEGYTFTDEIYYLSSEKIITGFPNGSFQPDAVVTRAQAAIMIGKALGLDGSERGTKFKDVTSAVTGSGYIASATEQGIITGFTDNTYRPYEPVTRGQMAIFLDRAFTLTTGKTNIFKDVSSEMVAYQAILNVTTEGVASGYPNQTFRPDQAVTRGQFSAFMARALEPTFRSLPTMTVKFLDVGQGDAIFIQYPNGKTALVDAGRYHSVIEAALKAENITKIDTLISTHPDADHIGGAAYVIENYGVEKVIDSGQIHTSDTFYNYLDTINASAIDLIVPSIGDNISDDPSVTAKVLSLDSHSSDLNDGSLVIMLSYGLTDVLLTGDAGLDVEERLMSQYDLDAEILKVSHHGSNTGTSGEFIDRVNPSDAILSYGENGYGHPHDEVVHDLLAYGVNLYHTYEQGTITATINGNHYAMDVDPVQWAELPAPGPNPAPNPVNPADPPGNGGQGKTSNQLRITAKDLSNEVVTIKNIGNTPITMTDWSLVSVEGNQTFTFPDGYVLQAGASVSITSGSKAVDSPPAKLLWTGSNIWNNSGDAARLIDPYGQLIHQLN